MARNYLRDLRLPDGRTCTTCGFEADDHVCPDPLAMAAPALLEAAKEALRDGVFSREVEATLRAAIQQAEGSQ